MNNNNGKNNKNTKNDYLKLIVVAPGRELASQIVSVARELLSGTMSSHSTKVVLAIGGTTFQRQVDKIRKDKPSIIVGTPGRLAELIVGRPGESNSRSGGGGKLAKFVSGVESKLAK